MHILASTTNTITETKMYRNILKGQNYFGMVDFRKIWNSQQYVGKYNDLCQHSVDVINNKKVCLIVFVKIYLCSVPICNK